MKPNPPASKIWTRKQSKAGRRPARPVVLFGLVNCATGLFQAWCIARILAAALAGRASVELWPVLAQFAIAAVLRAGFQAAGEIASARAGATARSRLRHGALAGILADGPRILRQTHSGMLTAMVVDRIEAVDGFFARYLPAATLMFAAPAVVLVAAACVQPFAALVLLCCGLAVPMMQAGFGIGAAVAARQQFQALSRLQTRFVDRMRGIATIVLAGRIEDEAARLATSAGELRIRTMRVLRVAFLASAGLDCAMAVALLVIALHDSAGWLHPGWLHRGWLRYGQALGAAPGTHRVPLSHALFALVLVPEFFAPFRAFSLAYQDRAQAASCGEELSRLPDVPVPEIPATEIPVAIRSVVPSDHRRGVSLAFDGVDFSWDTQRGPTLRDLTMQIAAGETVILTGASGAGKSTVIELLLGFIRPDGGRILIAGVDLAAIAPAELSGLIGWIGQTPVLFAGSLRENILFARPDADSAALEEAIAVAALDAVVADLPDGLDTQVGEGGYGLSGGQGQRVAIARAVLRNAPLLLLDEPTAHLDPDTERAIFDSLRRLARDRTVLMASHSGAAHLLGGRRIEISNGRLLAESCVA